MVADRDSVTIEHL